VFLSIERKEIQFTIESREGEGLLVLVSDFLESSSEDRLDHRVETLQSTTHLLESPQSTSLPLL
jgi:hypothetical protein